MKSLHSFDNAPQPKGDQEKTKIARETMGLDEGKQKQTAPKFHKMSIASGENGGAVVDMHDPSGNPTEKKPHIIGSDHPVMAHIDAIAQHCSKSSGIS